jgi:hypothetical protein
MIGTEKIEINFKATPTKLSPWAYSFTPSRTNQPPDVMRSGRSRLCGYTGCFFAAQNALDDTAGALLISRCRTRKALIYLELAAQRARPSYINGCSLNSP